MKLARQSGEWTTENSIATGFAWTWLSCANVRNMASCTRAYRVELLLAQVMEGSRLLYTSTVMCSSVLRTNCLIQTMEILVPRSEKK
jgi:hypothetical protein